MPHSITQTPLYNVPHSSSEQAPASRMSLSPPGLHSQSAAVLHMQNQSGSDNHSNFAVHQGSYSPSTVSPQVPGQFSQHPSNTHLTLSQPYSEGSSSRGPGSASPSLFFINQEAGLSRAQNGGQGIDLNVPTYYLMLEQQEKERENAEAADIAARQLHGSWSQQPFLVPHQQQQEATPLEDGMLSFATKDMDLQDSVQPDDSAVQEGYVGMSTPTQQAYQPLYEQQQQQRHKTLQSQQQQQGTSSSSSHTPQWDVLGSGFSQNEVGSGSNVINKDQHAGRHEANAGTATEGSSGSGTTPNSVLAQPGVDVSSSLSGHSTEAGGTPAPRGSTSGATAWPSNIPGMEALMAANVRSTGRLENASSNSSEQLVALHKFLQFARVEQQQQGNTRAVQMSYANETMHQPYPLEGQGPLPLGHQAAIQKAADLLRQRLPPNLPLSRTGSLESRQHASSSQPALGSTSQYMPQTGGLDSLAFGPPRASGSGPPGLARQQLGIGSHMQGENQQ